MKKIDSVREKEWFEDWFNSRYYHLLYQNRSQNEANFFIENLVEKLALNEKSNVLDLGCGKGRHAFKLSGIFKNVDGIDLSENNINLAKQIKKQNLHFYIGDMRNFNMKNKYNYVFNLFTSFGYFENASENLNVLQCINHHLVDGGYLLIDFLNTTLIKNKTQIKEVKVIQDVKFDIQKFVSGNCIMKSIQINDNDKTSKFNERVQLFNLKDFKSMFNETGFELIKAFGNYSLEPYCEESDRLILWAKKSNVSI